ncbi:MAG: Rho-binding antiterminator [Flavobacteriales bacterium]
MQLDRNFWETRYTTSDTGWDIGGPSTPLKEYMDQLTDKDLHILIPGAGRAYEAEYAHRLGFKNVFVIDLTDAPYADLLQRCPDFPEDHLLVGDLFEHDGAYDRIMEQTFFCALDPELRIEYVRKMRDLLKPGGKLVGVLFDDALNTDRPPFGGNRSIYEPIFATYFQDVSMEPCYNSIAPRAGRELWLSAVKKTETYVPIDCNVYDTFEAAATLKKMCTITLRNGEKVEGRIIDLFIKEKVELLKLHTGEEIRLDHVTDLSTN